MWHDLGMGGKNTNDLTGLMKGFCREYAIDFNATRAAIAAGYSKNGAAVTGTRLLRNPNIQKEIDRLIDDELGTSRNRLKKQVLSLTKEVAEKKKEFTDDKGNPILDDKGNPITDYKSADRDRLKALEMLGKYAGIFNDQPQQITATVEIVTPEERKKRIDELEAKRNASK